MSGFVSFLETCQQSTCYWVLFWTQSLSNMFGYIHLLPILGFLSLLALLVCHLFFFPIKIGFSFFSKSCMSYILSSSISITPSHQLTIWQRIMFQNFGMLTVVIHTSLSFILALIVSTNYTVYSLN